MAEESDINEMLKTEEGDDPYGRAKWTTICFVVESDTIQW